MLAADDDPAQVSPRGTSDGEVSEAGDGADDTSGSTGGGREDDLDVEAVDEGEASGDGANGTSTDDSADDASEDALGRDDEGNASDDANSDGVSSDDANAADDTATGDGLADDATEDTVADDADPDVVSNIGQPCTSTDDCTGVSPLCQLRTVEVRNYSPPSMNSGVDNEPELTPDQCESHDDCTADAPYCTNLTPDIRIGKDCGQCDTNEHCDEGACQWGFCFVQCEEASDCGRPEYVDCIQGVCVNTVCESDDDCIENATCDLDLGFCVPRECSSTDECAEGTCIESRCSTLSGRCIDPGALDPDPESCVCGEGRICVIDVDPFTGREFGVSRCEPLPEGCDSCSCAGSTICPQRNSVCVQTSTPHLQCSDWLM
jgi:hypothetical protein